MKLLGLQAVIRKKWCCRKYIKQNVTENLLNREFNAEKQGEKLVCDVTELKRINDKRYYLYSILDLCGNKIVAHNVSFHNDNGLVMNCLSKIPVAKKTTLLHSDQGSQFTSHAYANIAKEKSITLSMSRVGNCYDNAAKESFFGHFKEEFYIFHNPKTEQELFDAITSFIDYYNNERIQIRLKGSPSEYLLAHSL